MRMTDECNVEPCKTCSGPFVKEMFIQSWQQLQLRRLQNERGADFEVMSVVILV